MSDLRIPSVKKRAWAEIDLDNAQFNVEQIKKHTQSRLCCVIKANAYGHGAVQLARLYQSMGVDYLAVSNIEEALQLRRHQISLPILILGSTPPSCAHLLATNDITQCVFSYDYGRALAAYAEQENVTVRVHLKIDTGMGRLGFWYRGGSAHEIEEAISLCHATGLDAEGIFMHFATADEGESGEAYAREQYHHFMKAIALFEAQGIHFKIRHCANSAAIFDYPDFHLDMVRAGVVLYGLSPSEQMKRKPILKPVMSLHSVISHIKSVPVGESISYGRAYVTQEERRIATVPIGYADGFGRMNGQHGYALSVQGSLAPIVGRICMDQLMIDVTDIACEVGEEVILFDDHAPTTVDALAKLNQTINYEIICNIGERVPRAFLQNGAIVEWKDNILGE